MQSSHRGGAGFSNKVCLSEACVGCRENDVGVPGITAVLGTLMYRKVVE